MSFRSMLVAGLLVSAMVGCSLNHGTHPEPAKRIEAMREYLETMERPTPNVAEPTQEPQGRTEERDEKKREMPD